MTARHATAQMKVQVGDARNRTGMTPTARKASVVALWLVGIGAAFATESAGWATGWQIMLLVVVAAASTSRAVAEHVSHWLHAIRHPAPRRRAITAVCIAVVACAYLLFTGLRQKREIIAANKLDLATDNEALDVLLTELPDKEIFAISGATRQGVESLLETIWRALREDADAVEPPHTSPATE